MKEDRYLTIVPLRGVLTIDFGKSHIMVASGSAGPISKIDGEFN
jgi:hypothetical protein